MRLHAAMLHTVSALKEPLEEAAREVHHDLTVDHHVDESLLARAIAGGTTEELADAARPHIEAALAGGAQAVLVTCSSLGDATDALAALTTTPVLRIDRPMAQQAVQIGSRILVLATLGSTLAPTTALVRSEAAAHGVDADVRPVLVEGAATARAAGDVDLHDWLIRDAAHRYGPAVDAVVLAQASMANVFAPASPLPGVTILSSPDTGVRAFVEALRRAAAATNTQSPSPESGEPTP